MSFFAVSNLTSQNVQPCLPWEFSQSATVPDDVRQDKVRRQAWYQNPATKHQFYTPFEATNPTQRASKNNPPRTLYGFAADLDIVIPPERLTAIIESLKIQPSWVETSLGGKNRLVWLLGNPITVSSFDFAIFILQQAVKWLRIGGIPGFDEPAFVDPARLLANGCAWKSTGQPCIPTDDSQAFFVSAGAAFAFRDCNSTNIPLEAVEKAVRAKFPNLTWPNAFELESQGPSFWIPESTSAQSAILKRDGMFTFSQHAVKPFYTWADILGLDFVKKYAVSSIAKATDDIYWDGKQYYCQIEGNYRAIDTAEMVEWFEAVCGLSNRSEKGCVSNLKKAKVHIHRHNRIVGAGPFVGRPAGKIIYRGEPVLNTYINKVVQPADELTPWGLKGMFPLISEYLDGLFDPHSQLAHNLRWYKRFYKSMLEQDPKPGQCIFLMGKASIGKTLYSKRLVGDSVGGGMDASDFLTRHQPFNVHAFSDPVWQLDDEGISESAATQSFFAAILKKVTANQEFLSHAKFATPTSVTWMGRVIVTANLDYVSSRCLGGLDNSSLDKTNLYRCSSSSSFVFPERTALEAQIKRELPYFLRWLLSMEDPAETIYDKRYGYASFQHESLMEKAHQGSKSAPFMELLIGELSNYFADHPNATEWRGSTTNVLKFLNTNPQNELLMRSLRLESTNRYLELIERGNLIPCRAETGSMKTRIWIFARPGSIVRALELPEATGLNPFEKPS